jgi:tetratricopeptide (TPR) repeat protein
VQTVCALDLEGPFPHLSYAFGEHIERANLINTCNEMFALVREKPESYKTALPGFVRLNMMDPQAFSACAKKLADYVPRMNFSEAQDLTAMIEEVWEQDYHFPGSPNVTFWLAHLCYGLGRYQRSMEFFDITMKRTGVDEVLLFLKGQCLDAMGQRADAMDCYRRSLEINPQFAEAREALFGR